MRLEVLNQGIEAGVLGYDVKEGAAVRCSELSDVVSDVEVEGVRPVPRDLDVLGSFAELLKSSGSLEWNLALTRTYEDHQLEVILS